MGLSGLNVPFTFRKQAQIFFILLFSPAAIQRFSVGYSHAIKMSTAHYLFKSQKVKNMKQKLYKSQPNTKNKMDP